MNPAARPTILLALLPTTLLGQSEDLPPLSDPFTAAWLIEHLERDAERFEPAFAAAFDDPDATLPQRLLAGARLYDRARTRGEDERADAVRQRLRGLIDPRQDDRPRSRGRSRREADFTDARRALLDALDDGDPTRIRTARAVFVTELRAEDEDGTLHRVTSLLLRQIDEQRADAIATIYAELADARQSGDTARIAKLRHRLAEQFGPRRGDVSAREDARSLRRRFVELLLENGTEAANQLRDRLDRRQRGLLRGDRRRGQDLESTLRALDARAEAPATHRVERELLQRIVGRARDLLQDGDRIAAEELLRQLPRGPW